MSRKKLTVRKVTSVRPQSNKEFKDGIGMGIAGSAGVLMLIFLLLALGMMIASAGS